MGRASQLVVEKQKNVDLIRLVQSLEQQRHSLVEGEACPLCGSSDHPYASPEHLPSLQLSTAIAEHQKAVTQQEQFREALGELEKLKAAQNADLKRATADLKILIGQIERREILWTTKVTALGIELNATQNAELNVFLVDETQRQALLKKRVADLRNQEGALRIADQEVEKSKSLLGANRAGYDKNLSLLQQTKETLLKAVGRFGALELSVNQTRSGLIQLLTVFKVDAQDLDAAGDAVKQMKQRSDLFFAKTEGRGTIEKEMGALDAAIAEVAKQIEVETAKIVDFKKEEKLGLVELQELQILRQGKFDQKLVIPDQERVSSLIKESRKKNESVLEVLNNRGNEEKKCKTDLDRVVNEVQIRGVKLNEDTTKLTLDVNTAGFETLNHLRNSVLTEPQVNEIGVLRKGLENRAQALVGRRAANDALKIPDTAKNDAPEIESLTDQQIKIEAERELLHQNSGAIKEELRQDDERRKSQLAILEQIQTAEQGFQRWDCLSKLIGSAKGVVFAKFAQSLTLERLIAVANRHLAQLSPRYSMSRSKADIDDLEIEIIDHYQGDVTRPMSSLSGGESFLASLALAVGLSELASGQTAIESLFIDEGFGSLDPGTLETAMAALETLQTSGKMIGVISHVDAMKERISTQIQIQKMEGGRSILKIVA